MELPRSAQSIADHPHSIRSTTSASTSAVLVRCLCASDGTVQFAMDNTDRLLRVVGRRGKFHRADFNGSRADARTVFTPTALHGGAVALCGVESQCWLDVVNETFVSAHEPAHLQLSNTGPLAVENPPELGLALAHLGLASAMLADDELEERRKDVRDWEWLLAHKEDHTPEPSTLPRTAPSPVTPLSPESVLYTMVASCPSPDTMSTTFAEVLAIEHQVEKDKLENQLIRAVEKYEQTFDPFGTRVALSRATAAAERSQSEAARVAVANTQQILSQAERAAGE